MPAVDVNPFKLLVLVPVDDTESFDPLAIVAAAAAIGGESRAPVHALLLGRAPQEEQGKEALRAGADQVWLASHPELDLPVQTDQLLSAFVQALSNLDISGGSETTLTLLPAGAIGEELAARLAARVNGVALGRCAQIELTAEGVVAHRPAFAGRAQVTLAPAGGPLFAAIRGPKRVQAAVSTSDAIDAAALHSLVLGNALPESDASYVQTGQKMVRLEGAKIVVSGGRGMGGPDGFALLDRLAASLGGALGGSLPTVDAGWIPVARQVGQSGKFVMPEVYLAVAISGTPQHLAGVGLDTRIVAINSDAEANIFRVAEIGAVAEWQSVIPALIEALRAN